MAWHARKSASGSKQWIECPGSLALVDSLPADMRSPTNAAAMTGTCAHAVGEFCLRNALTEVPEHLHDTIVWLDQGEDAHLLQLNEPQIETAGQLSAELGVDVKFMCRVDQKMVDGVQLYLDVVWDDLKEMGNGTEILIEERFDMNWLRPGLGGTADCTLWQFLGLLRVTDYKNGYVVVSAEDNTQGLSYALGMAQRVDWNFEECEVVIVQPNAQTGQRVKRWRVSRADLEAFRDRLAAASDRVDEAGELFQKISDEVEFIEWAGEFLSAGKDGGHCTYCDALPTCPAARWAAEAQARADFAEEPPLDNPLEIHDDATLARLADILRWGSFLDKLVKSATTLGQRRLEQGLPMPGYKLVAGKANRQWVSTDKEVATLILTDPVVKTALTDKDLYEDPKPPAFKSPAQMEKLGPARSPVRKRVKELVASLSHKPDGKLAMAPESDPREAVVSTGAVEDFAEDEAE